MNIRLFEVRQRRSELLAKIASQREQVAEIGASWKAPLALVDRGLVVARFLRSHLALTAGLAALVTIRRRGVVGLGMAVWKGWKLYRFTKSFAANLMKRG